MQCDVCKRPPNSQLRFNCTVCARNKLYEYRIFLAQALLQQEAAERDVEQSLKGSQSLITKNSGTGPSATKHYSPSLAVELATVERTTLKEKSRLIHEQVESLRKEANEMQTEIAKKKDMNGRRRMALGSARQELSRHGATDFDVIGKATSRTQHRWNVVHAKTAESRMLLCKEAASLYVLQQRERRSGTSNVETYHIGGLQIHNLKDLNRKEKSLLTIWTHRINGSKVQILLNSTR